MIAMAPCPPVPARPTPWDHARDAVIDLDVPEAGRAAWRFVAAAVFDWRLADLLDTVHAVVAELVTNAITHARRPAGWHLLPIRIRRQPRALVIEVDDADPGRLPSWGSGDVWSESGRGGPILAALCTSTDVRCRGGIKTVRVAVALPARHDAAVEAALDADTSENVAAIRAADYVATIAPPPGRDRLGTGTLADAEAWLARLNGGS